MKSTVLALVVLAAGGAPGAVAADAMIAAEQIAGSKIGILLSDGLSNATLSVSGPNDFHADTSSKSGALAIDLATQGQLDDGTYVYQVVASTGKPAVSRSTLDNGRDKSAEFQPTQSVAMSGTFQVRDGKIIKPERGKPERRDR